MIEGWGSQGKPQIDRKQDKYNGSQEVKFIAAILSVYQYFLGKQIFSIWKVVDPLDHTSIFLFRTINRHIILINHRVILIICIHIIRTTLWLIVCKRNILLWSKRSTPFIMKLTNSFMVSARGISNTQRTNIWSKKCLSKTLIGQKKYLGRKMFIKEISWESPEDNLCQNKTKYTIDPGIYFSMKTTKDVTGCPQKI